MYELTLEETELVAGGGAPSALAVAGAFAGGALVGAALAAAALYGAYVLLKR